MILYVSSIHIRHSIRSRYVKHIMIYYVLLSCTYVLCTADCIWRFLWIVSIKSEMNLVAVSLEWPTLCRLASFTLLSLFVLFGMAPQSKTCEASEATWYSGLRRMSVAKRVWPCRGVLEAHTLGESWWRNWLRRGSSCTGFVGRGHLKGDIKTLCILMYPANSVKNWSKLVRVFVGRDNHFEVVQCRESLREAASYK